MFARYYVELPIAFGAVEGMLLEAPVEWVPGLLRAAEDRGQHLLADVGFEVDPASRAWRNDWIVANRLAPVASLSTVEGQPVDWPVTHVLLVARRPVNS